MATSLAAQLQRLAAPQTSVQVESRRTASILFDGKEAATKDREVIFDIGLSGLEELIQLNGAFARFEETLFDRNAMDLQRSVEDQTLNEMLDANVRKFFYHLSPYFMLQPAHKCLEWLIRRFNVHQFNRRDFVNFILPYHETRMFVRCIQTLRFQATNDQLAFLEPIGKAGVPPSKRIIIEHFTAHPEFLKQYGKFLMEATTELGSKANALQAMFAFFCTTTLGVLESVESVTENYVVAVLRPVAAGLACNAVDYASACYMIVGQLVTKTALSWGTLEMLTKRLCCAEEGSQRSNAVMLLVLIFQTQHERLSPIPNKLMKRLIRTNWIPQVLSEVKADGIDVLMCYRKILETSLGEICQSFHSIGFYSQICEQLLLEIALTDPEAEDIIQCVLDSYIGTGKSTAKKNKPSPKPMDDDDETINLDSDSEEENFKSRHENVTRWYSDFLKSLERQYPTPFDRVVKRAMKGQEQYSHRKRNALKNVLGFLLQASCDENEAFVFENLFHYDAHRRSHAVNYIVENFDRLTSKRRGRLDLLRESISERLDDDSCAVVKEVLRLSPAQLLATVGADSLVTKLNHLTLKCAANPEYWKLVTHRAIAMLTSEQIYTSVNINRVIIALYPLLFSLGDDPVGQKNVEFLLQTPFAKKYLVPAFYGSTANCDILLRTLEETGQCTNPVQVCFNILLLSSALPSPCSVDQADRVLRYARKQLTGHRFQYAMSSDMQCLMAGKLPVDVITVPIRYIIERVRIDPTSVDMNFDRQNVALRLQLSIFSDLLQRYCIIDPQFTDLRSIFGNLLKKFLTQLYPELGARVEFLSHFYTVHLIERPTDVPAEEDSSNFSIGLELQVRAVRLTNTMLGQMVDQGCEIPFNALTNVILALTSEHSLVRECAMSTIQLIVQLEAGNRLSKPTGVFLRCLLKRREELSIDGEQLSMVLFMMREGEKGKTIKPILESFIERLNDPNTPAYIAAGIVDMVKLLDDPLLLVRPATKVVAILEAVNGDKARLTFDLYEAKMLQILLGRYTADVTEQVMRNEICQRVITVALQCHKAMVVPGRRKHCTPAILMIEALADELFEALPKSYAKRVLLHIVEAAALSEHPETNSVTAKLFKGCTIDAALAVDLVTDMSNQSSQPTTVGSAKSLRNSIIAVAPCERVLSTAMWKRGVTLLEHLQNKKKLENAHLLVPKLFDCLKYCLDFEEQSVVEYVKQIILSLLLHCIVKVEQQVELEGSTDVARVFGNVGTVFKVEQIVQCIRGSQNPQTHHHALLLLGHVARYVPEQVLHNMMEIFTFVGSSIVRQDDAYSFQIISKTIETIVPTIAGSESSSQEQVIPILKIFSDIILDVPEHRRIALYVKLLQTLGANEYLWVFLGVLIESDVMKGGRKAELKSQRGKSRAETELATSELSKRMEVALLIAREFEPTVIVQTCTNLIDYLRELPMEPEKRKKEEEEELMEVDMSDTVIFNVKAHTNRHLRHFKYALVQFVGGLVSSVFVINKIAQLNEEETLGMKKYYQNLIVGILTYVKDVSKTIDRLKEEKADEKIPLYWRVMLSYCYDILESTISLLSADTLIIVVHGLLKHRFLMVRRKVLELLNNKLQYKQDYFEERHHPGLLQLLDPLMELVKHSHEEESVVGTSIERSVIVQLCYISLRHLSKILTQHATKKVQSVLADLVAELHGYKKNPNPQVLASLILCIGELCSNLGPHSIHFLPKFVPMVNKFLNAQLKSEDPVDMLTYSIVLLMVKIVDSLSRFLSPYLCSMLVVLAQLYALVEQRNDSAMTANMLSRLALIWNNLAGTIAPRVMIPVIEESYHELVGEGELAAIGPLMKLLSTTFGKLKSSDFTAIRGELAELFLTVLQFRCNQSASDTFTLAAIDAAEAHVIRAFVVLILKLSESTFRPLFYQVFEWSIRESSSNDRAITFFNVCAHVAEALKSLFVLFASDLVTIAAKLLNATNSAKVGDGTAGHEEELHFELESKNVTLLRYVLKTLYCIVLYDNQNFINAVRFDMLLGPITDQLENGLIINVTEVRTLVIDCLAQMAVAVMDDSLWRQLNYQVLLKTRNNEPEVRMFALEACTEIARKLGESYAPLLPETIPFLAELMEDDNEDVEKAVHHSCREIGRATGEDLQKYF